MPRLLLATTNRGKAAEYHTLLKGLDWDMVTLDQVGISQEADESYATYEENARSKAEFYLALSGLVTLADDSGLEVDALGGKPGVRSSRYAGDNASDADRVNYLLRKLSGVVPENRSAKFRCVIAVAIHGKDTVTFEGECLGRITLAPAGYKGFGYDPVFFLPEYNKTIAEIDPDLKNEISHRGRAAQKAYSFLKEL
ncbi:MAG: RdgB/HAM1 family non-canonical purine NTP pyrophosphatase [Dehalococcoidia bacterium]|nr:RdgB/HAM1 family non-canonical purine NTP pyrophosphatase [Dehalococcoidia bacterium]